MFKLSENLTKFICLVECLYAKNGFYYGNYQL